MAIANQEMIRDNNRRQVLEYLVNHPPVSRAALSQQRSAWISIPMNFQGVCVSVC